MKAFDIIIVSETEIIRKWVVCFDEPSVSAFKKSCLFPNWRGETGRLDFFADLHW